MGETHSAAKSFRDEARVKLLVVSLKALSRRRTEMLFRNKSEMHRSTCAEGSTFLCRLDVFRVAEHHACIIPEVQLLQTSGEEN